MEAAKCGCVTALGNQRTIETMDIISGCNRSAKARPLQSCPDGVFFDFRLCLISEHLAHNFAGL